MSTPVVDVIQQIREHQNQTQYHDLHWEGSFADYLRLVQEHPQAARNSFQRLYDMIVSYGEEEYIDNKKRLIRYPFFRDPIDHGKLSGLVALVFQHNVELSDMLFHHVSRELVLVAAAYARIHQRHFREFLHLPLDIAEECVRHCQWFAFRQPDLKLKLPLREWWNQLRPNSCGKQSRKRGHRQELSVIKISSINA